MTSRSIAIYRALPGAQADQSLTVSGFGMQTIRSQVVGRALDVYAVVFVESGEGTLTTGGIAYAVTGPSLFFLTPGMMHSYGPAPGTEWSERWALFDGSLAREFEKNQLIDRNVPIAQLDDATEMARFFSTLHSEMLDHTSLSRAACAATLHRLVVRAAMQQRAAANPQTASSAGALDALKHRALQNLDLSLLAKEFQLSPATLRRHCLDAYGVPPKVLQTRLRLDRAKELLAVTSQTIETISLAVGFEDSFYFSRIFLKYERCSPTTFRKLNRRS